MRGFMDRALVKSSVCPCGTEKDIVWIEPLRFQMGFEESCYGYSVCTNCDIFQSHYSGSLEGAIEFQKFNEQYFSKAANDDKF